MAQATSKRGPFGKGGGSSWTSCYPTHLPTPTEPIQVDSQEGEIDEDVPTKVIAQILHRILAGAIPGERRMPLRSQRNTLNSSKTCWKDLAHRYTHLQQRPGGRCQDRSTSQEKEARVRHMSQEKGKHEPGKSKARVRKKQGTSQEKAKHDSGKSGTSQEKAKHESGKSKARFRKKKARVRKKQSTSQEKAPQVRKKKAQVRKK